MTLPSFTDPFNSYYDDYSIKVDNINIPYYWDIFMPDNQIDFQCRSIICPNPDKGAIKWTLNKKWITIGIYRDEGRDPSIRDLRFVSWSRSGKICTIYDPQKHRLNVGDSVTVYNANVQQLVNRPIISVTNEYYFSIDVPSIGLTSGNLHYQPYSPINFYEEYCVFRLLPSFKLIPYSLVLQLFEESAPKQTLEIRELFNITNDSIQSLPQAKNKNVNFEYKKSVFTQTSVSNLQRRFKQIYDETGKPLPLNYNEHGYLDTKKKVFSKNSNERVFYNQPQIIEDPDWDGSRDIRVHAYDCYGIDINGYRGPYLSYNIITRDLLKTGPRNNIAYQKHNNIEIYPLDKHIFDAFGNIVIGIQENNTTLVREPTLPLELDEFNLPVKQASSTRYPMR